MAWRIDEQVIRGEIDFRQRGVVTGKIWLNGRDEPVELELEGAPWRDLAGHVLRFTNPEPQEGDVAGLVQRQVGVVGDITASRKVKVPDVSEEEFLRCFEAREPFPWHWSNSLYLEWFSERNGRVVIESADYELELEPAAAWEMSEDEEARQQLENARALTRFMERLAGAAAGDDADDDAPQSKAEAKADAEAARMDLLLDRVSARIEREDIDDVDFEKIYFEERERLRRERGEPEEKPLTPEQIERQQAWIEEMNAVAEEAMEEMESESWKDDEPDERHPLVERASDLAVRVHAEVRENGWLPEDAVAEHPLREIIYGTMSASAKLAGALGMDDDEEWPPDPLLAGNVLVRLKKARDWLRDVLGGLDSVEEENLAPVAWCAEIRHEAAEILGEVQDLIREVREVLADGE